LWNRNYIYLSGEENVDSESTKKSFLFKIMNYLKMQDETLI